MSERNRYEHRRAEKKLILLGPDRSVLSNSQVTIAQKRHKFMFGCGAFDAVPLADGELQGEEKAAMEDRFDKWLALFNTGTLPFYWGRFEPEQGKPQTAALKNAARWLKEHGAAPKGHPLCWHTSTAPWLLRMSNQEILKAQLDRIQRDAAEFRGLVDIWDVINEVVIMPDFDKYDNGITRICKELGRIQTVKEMFASAKAANPEAILLINDFNTSAAYEILIEGCLEAGIPIDAIGIQSHQHQGYWGLEKTRKVLERYSRFGLPIHFTENTLISGELMPPEIDDLNDFQVKEWPTTPEGEERQAREIAELYQTLFAHPLVEAITTWSIVDGKWLNAPAGILREDNSCKPAYDRLLQLIKQEWWTTEQPVTDQEGRIGFTGYLGDYEVSAGGRKAEFTVDKTAGGEVLILQ